MYPETYGNQGYKPQKGSLLSRLLKPSIRQKTVPDIDMCDREYNELIESIRNAKMEWENASWNFEYADGEDLIDYYTYKIKACEIRYEYFLKKAKEKGINVNL